MQSYVSHPQGTVFNLLIFFLFCHYLAYWFVMKNIGNYRKYDFFNFHFMENMIFPSIAENHENVKFMLSVFKKMLIFLQWAKISEIQ